MGTTRDKEVGALWAKVGRESGTKFWTGTIKVGGQTIEVIMFENRDKRSDKAPDFRILESTPIEERREQQSQPRQNVPPSQRQRENDAPASRRYEGHQHASGGRQDERPARRDDDDIPF